jgi:DNA-directed RNA polymerase subunit N (RpoN/RPB10)
MLVPIVCFTCGLPLGDVEDLFLTLRAEKVRKELEARGTVATQAAFDAGLQVECADILDELGIVYDCCRTHLVTAMIFTDYY